MKAYTVTDEWGEGHAVVMFAKHNVVARRNGANALDCDFESVSCTRSPEFDSYAETGHVPPLVKIDHGWWMECWQCSARLDLDDYDDERPRSAMVEHGERVFCNATCMAAFDAERAAYKARFEEFKRRITEGRPDLAWRHFGGETGGTCYATFGFPGGKYGGSVRMDDDELSWSVASGDMDAWTAYEASRSLPRENSGT